MRFFPVRGTYLIVYDPASEREPLEVLRFLHGSRDVTSQLSLEGSVFTMRVAALDEGN